MLAIDYRYLLKKILFLVGMTLALTFLLSILSVQKAKALDNLAVQDYCGIRGTTHDFAGLVVNVDYVDISGKLHDAPDVRVAIKDKGPGSYGGNIVDYAGGGRDTSGRRFGQMAFDQNNITYTTGASLGGPWNWGCPNGDYNADNTPKWNGSTGVVLGYSGHGNGWVLDCDISRHSDYNEEFDVSAEGNNKPVEARAGGFWRLELYGASAVAPPNGGTQWVTLRYYEPNYPVGRYTVGYSSGPTASGCETGSTTNNTIATIRGWAIDRRNPQTQINVDIYIDSRAGDSNPKVYRVAANSPPPPPYNNVFESYGADYSTVNHSFSFNIPSQFLDGNNHTVRVYPLDPTKNNSGFPAQQGNGDPNALVFWNMQNQVETTFNSNSLPVLTAQSTFCPWLRTQNGNVLALSDPAQMGVTPQPGDKSITDQVAGVNGSRQLALQKHEPSDPDTSGVNERLYDNSPVPKYIKEASYVIIARLGTNNFCSTNFYTLGSEYNSTSALQADFTNPCKSPTAGYDIAQTMDSLAIFTNLNNTFNSTNPPMSTTTCNVNSATVALRYRKGSNIGTNGTAADISGNLTENIDCPTVRALATESIAGGNNIFGRATLLAQTSINIAGDIIYSTDTSFNSVHKVPNLAIVVNGDVNIYPNVKRIDATIYATGRIKTCNTPGNLSYSYPSSRCGDPKLVNIVPNVTDGQLIAHGFWIGAKGFEWGRNYFERPKSPGPGYHDYAAVSDFPGNAAERIIGNGWIIAYPPPGFEDAFTPNFTNTFYFGGELNPRY